MPILSGNGSWVTLQKLPVGGFIEGRFVSYEQEVPSNNPMYGPQDILTLNVNGQVTKIGAPAALKRVMRAHPEIKPGQLLKLTHQGKKRSKKGASFTAKGTSWMSWRMWLSGSVKSADFQKAS